MRTRNEKLLAALLLAIIFGAGNFYGYEWLSQRQNALELKYAALHAGRIEAEVDLEKLDIWKQRQKWIQEHEPVLGDEGDAKAQVLQYVLKGARDHHLEILEQSLNDSQQGAAGTRVNVGVKVKGPMQSLCQWLADLQKPDSFYAVSQFSLKADQDQKSMVCTLQLARYFKGGS
jgi:hypothetical protein